MLLEDATVKANDAKDTEIQAMKQFEVENSGDYGENDLIICYTTTSWHLGQHDTNHGDGRQTENTLLLREEGNARDKEEGIFDGANCDKGKNMIASKWATEWERWWPWR